MCNIEINNREGAVERVSAEKVAREWAGQEFAEDRDIDVESRPPEELVEMFEDPEQLAKSIFFEEDLEWCQIALTERELRNLLVVKGPEDKGWRAVAEGNDIESVAERIAEADSVEALNEEVPKDVADITDMAEEHGLGEGAGAFIAVQESIDDPAYLADGNHRAVAIIHRVIQGGAYDEQETYVGIPPAEDSADIDEESTATGDHPSY